jgi:tripartite-type tricarboxylate transporter receptor subunit TctC
MMPRLSVSINLMLLTLTASASAQETSSFYAGKHITLIVGYPSGAAYDIYARLVGRHIGRHVPGQPNVVISNMPGASSLIAANVLANSANRDGTVIGAVFERIAVEPLVNPNTARFDGRAFNWIGSVLKVTDVCMFWHTAKAQSIEDAKRMEVIVGAAGDAGNSALAPRLLNTFIGTKFKIVGGYGGTEMFLAMERGETEARCGMSWGGLKASRPDWLAQNKVKIVMQMATQKHPELFSVPNIIDLVTDQESLSALEYLYATQEMGRPFLAPPLTPADRVAALRKAFDDTMADPVFLEDAKKSNQEVDPIPGTRVQEIVEQLYKTPRATIERVEELRRAK